jgi:hypothetical protein
MASQGAPLGKSRFRLTIGELFPDGDLVAQWVFSVTALVEDIQVGTHPSKEAQVAGDLRAMLFWHRHMVTRLYEARRLVTTARTVAEVRGFAETLLQNPPGGVDLSDAYKRPSKDVPSTIERLYEELRHLTVHYAKVGGDELRDTLRQYAGLPAEITIETRTDGSPDLQFRWVQAVRGMEVFGDVHQPDFLKQMRDRSELTGRIVASWTMAAGLAVILNARRLGIDTNKLGDISGWAPPSA